MIASGMFVCSSFLISVCMFIVSKALLISSAAVIVRAGGDVWSNPFTTVLFSVCMVCLLLILVNSSNKSNSSEVECRQTVKIEGITAAKTSIVSEM